MDKVIFVDKTVSITELYKETPYMSRERGSLKYEWLTPRETALEC